MLHPVPDILGETLGETGGNILGELGELGGNTGGKHWGKYTGGNTDITHPQYTYVCTTHNIGNISAGTQYYMDVYRHVDPPTGVGGGSAENVRTLC